MRPGRVRPGSLPRARELRPGRNRFNEAGARTPRKHGAPQLERRDPDPASMRPGRVRPGSPRKLEPNTLYYGLSFNEAGARTPRKPCHDEFQLPAAAEASMRPGRVRPGSSITFSPIHSRMIGLQ